MDSTLKKATKANYAISQIIANTMKPITEAEYIKECLNAIVEIICPETKSVFIIP